MTEKTLNPVTLAKDIDGCRKIMLYGFLIRLLLLIFMLFIATSFTEPYFLKDDIKYEETAAYYMDYASSVIDIQKLADISDGYIAPFWPWVVSIVAYMFRWVYAGRVINIILSTLTIGVIFNLTYNISGNNKTALLAAKMMAFLPVTVITCCFPLKDIFIMFGVFYAFDVFVSLQKGEKVGITRTIICAALMTGVYYSRGAVTELLVVFFFGFFLMKFIREKRYSAAILSILLAVGVMAVFGRAIMSSFEMKLEDYGGEATSDGGVAALTVHGITDIYKLPFAIFFANLQPIKMNLFTESSLSWWHNVLAHANISIYPVAIANFLYIFGKKHNTLFWILSMIMYSAVISLSLGVFRHYLFLIPLEIINCAFYFDVEKTSNRKATVILGSLGLFMLMLIYTLRKAL